MRSTLRSLGTGAADALALAAARFGVGFDKDSLDARFTAHAAGTSLRALVEIAPELGLEAKAFQSDPASLHEAILPAVVHLVDRETEEAGFALLTEVTKDGVRIAVESDGGETGMSAAEFAAFWSGILVTIARPAGSRTVPALAPRGPIGRLRAWYWKEDPLARAALAGRVVGGGLMLVLAAWSAILYGAARGSTVAAAGAVAAVLAAVAGAILSASLFYQGRRTLVAGVAPRLASAVCGRGRYADCLGVLATKFARVAGIDWASVGLALFASNLLLFAWGAGVGEGGRETLFSWLAITYLLDLPAALFFVALQIWPLRRICPLCMGVHAVVLLSALLGVVHLLTGDGIPPFSALVPFAALHLAAFLGAFALVLPVFSFGLEAKVSRARLGWVGATPWGALAEIAGRPPVAETIPAAPIRLGHPRAPFRIEVLVHPFCSGCGPVVVALRGIAGRFDRHVSVGFHVPVRDTASEDDRALCTALAAVGLLAGGERGVEAFLRVKENPRPAFAEAAKGAPVVLAHLLDDPSVGAGAPVLEEAAGILDDINRFADAIERGTPTLLLNGRLWDGTVEDLDALLSRYSPLLAEALRIPRSPAVDDDAPAAGRNSEA